MQFKSWKYQVVSNATGRVKLSFSVEDNNWKRAKQDAMREAAALTWKHPKGDGFSVKPRIETISHID